MALHYSSAKYIASLKSKAAALGAIPAIQSYESWEVIPESAIETAEASAKLSIQQAMNRDGHVLWAMPTSLAETSSKFALRNLLKQQAQTRREQAAGAVAVRSMPDHIGNKQTSAFQRDGKTLCGAYQIGRCPHNATSCSALHRFAILFRSGRVCGGNHPGDSCRDRRYLSHMPPPSGERPPEPVGVPPSKKRKTEEPSSSNPEETREDAMVEVIEEESPPSSPASCRAQLAEAEFDRLATVGAKTAQAPTAVCKSERGGTVWLAGLPTSDNQHRFPTASLQITCFSDEVTQRGGVVLRNCMNLQVAPTSPKLRFDQWRLVWPTLKATYFLWSYIVWQGAIALLSLLPLCRSLLMEEDLKQSEDFLKGKRDIDLPAIMYKQGIRAWMREARRQSVVGPPGPRVTGFCATSRSHLHLATAANHPICTHKQKASGADRLVDPLFTEDTHEALAWGRPTCQACFGRAPASWQSRIQLR